VAKDKTVATTKFFLIWAVKRPRIWGLATVETALAADISIGIEILQTNTINMIVFFYLS